MINDLENQGSFIVGMDVSLFSHIIKNKIKIGNDIIIYNISLNNFISSKKMKKTLEKIYYNNINCRIYQFLILF